MDQKITDDFGQRLRDKLTQLTGDPRAAGLADFLTKQVQPEPVAPSNALFTLFARMTEAAEIVTQSDRLARMQIENSKLQQSRSELSGQAGELRSMLAGVAETLGHKSGTTEVPTLVKFVETRMRQLKAISDGVRTDRTDGVIEAIANFVNTADRRNSDQAENARLYSDLCAKLDDFGDSDCTIEQKIDAMETALKSLQRLKEAADDRDEGTRKMHNSFKGAIEIALGIENSVGLGQIVSHISSQIGAAKSFRSLVCEALSTNTSRTDAFIVEMVKRAQANRLQIERQEDDEELLGDRETRS